MIRSRNEAAMLLAGKAQPIDRDTWERIAKECG
jgi:hypothetical protein